MRAEALRELLAKLDECQADAGAIAEFRRMIEAVGRAYGVDVDGQAGRIAFARQQLDAGAQRVVIKDRIMARFGVKESQAYRDIGVALQTVPKSA